MTDIVSPEDRSRMMAGIRSKDTKPELIVRKGLHKRGFRYNIHDRRLPGKPDISFPRYRAVIEINGCLWHAHDCHLFKWPSTRNEFWKKKINGNRERDSRNREALGKSGWKVLIIWECALKGRTRKPLGNVLDLTEEWLKSGQGDMDIEGIEQGSEKEVK
jgi:DNA mismatch endonuclease (patch repair protein)